jgi:hypothetical protein
MSTARKVKLYKQKLHIIKIVCTRGGTSKCFFVLVVGQKKGVKNT